MTISIVIATFNAAKYLAECLDSCIAQTWQDKEIIVVDGGSTDGTVDIIKRYGEQIAYWHSKPDKGVYDAWNQALDHVTGEWVLFRGADDLFDATTSLERMIPHLGLATDGGMIVYGLVHVISPDGEYHKTRGAPWSSLRPQFQQRMVLPHPATFHRRTAFDRFGRFNTSYRIAGDYEFLLRILRHTDARFAPGIVVSRMRMGGLSSKGKSRVYFEAMRARWSNGYRRPPWRLCWELVVVCRSRIMWSLLSSVFGEARLHEAIHKRKAAKARKLACMSIEVAEMQSIAKP